MSKEQENKLLKRLNRLSGMINHLFDSHEDSLTAESVDKAITYIKDVTFNSIIKVGLMELKIRMKQ